MGEGPDEARLRRLEARLERARAARAPPPPETRDYALANLAWRMVIELVAGLAIGFGIGLGLDAAFGTRPVLMVVFTLAGFAAGVKTMIRTAREVGAGQRGGGPGPASEKRDGGGGER
ncbi:MAG: AtpZ/AtpI family protein [Rhodobacteraceae bacterium]|nr:AtpZ/AtpI family protein [Paracoccaceae bacterium]